MTVVHIDQSSFHTYEMDLLVIQNSSSKYFKIYHFDRLFYVFDHIYTFIRIHKPKTMSRVSGCTRFTIYTNNIVIYYNNLSNTLYPCIRIIPTYLLICYKYTLFNIIPKRPSYMYVCVCLYGKTTNDHLLYVRLG